MYQIVTIIVYSSYNKRDNLDIIVKINYKGFSMLKDIIYTGVGGALLLKERVEEELNRLEERGKLSKDDTKKFLDDLKSRGEEEQDRAKEQIKEALKEVIDELGVATKEDIAKIIKEDTK